MELIKTEVIMLPESEGGRVSPLTQEAFGGNYRPHIVIGSRNQRKAVIKETKAHPRTLTEHYRPVAFISGPKEKYIPIGQEIVVTLELMYFPDVDYSDVTVDSTFTLREGPKIVGHGVVLERWHDV